MVSAAKRQREKVELDVDLSAKSMAEDWLRQMGGDKGDAKDGEEESKAGKKKKKDKDGGQDGVEDGDEGFTVPRPSRLGIGAKFIPHSKALDVSNDTGDRISGKLKRVKKMDDDGVAAARRARQQLEEEQEESRTGAIKVKATPTPQAVAAPSLGDGKKKKKKKKKKNESSEMRGGAEGGGRAPDGNGAKGSSVSSKGAAKDEDDGENEGAPQPRKESGGGGGGGGGAGGGPPGKKGEGENGEWVDRPGRRKRVKGKKTRSRQKNLRRDNRPAHLKPGYVPE